MVEKGAYSLIPFSKRHGLLENPARLSVAILLVWLVYELYQLRKQSISISIKKAQLNYFLLGTIIFAASAALLGGVFQLFGGLGFDPALSSYFSLPWVALTYYSIGRYRLFDIQIAISRTLTIVLFLTGAVAVHIGLFKLLEPVIGSIPAILVSLSIIFFIFLKTPLKKKIETLINDIVLRNKYGYQEILRESTRAVATISDLNELLNYIVVIIGKSLKVESICLFIKEEDGLYHAHCSCGIDKKTASAYKLGSGIINWLMLTRQVFIREEQEMLKTPENFSAVYTDLGKISAELVIPLFHKGELAGILTLGYKGNREIYVQSDIDLLESLADQAAIAIKNIRLSAEAITDGLTGLYVHKYFNIRLQEEIERAKRYRHPLSLLLIDVDHFKRVNDAHGHLAGDRILRAISRLWKDNIRSGDVLSRYGGEEFAVILPETSKADAVKVAETLRSYTESARVDGIRVTISIGVASIGEGDLDCDRNKLIRNADKALYLAKHKGRNRTELTDW
ncbi:MAG: sensor domain-containing diguanylate cyclase [Nitrospirae bacterium]|nr:sensor domain-containing diguanylate cyclase [Nitrospirota bacterium]